MGGAKRYGLAAGTAVVMGYIWCIGGGLVGEDGERV